MAKTCWISPKVTRAIDAASTYLSDRTAMLNTWLDELQAKFGPLDNELNIKQILDLSVGKSEWYAAQDRTLVDELVQTLARSARERGIATKDFQAEVSEYAKMQNLIERIKTFHALKGRKYKEVVTLRPASEPRTKRGSTLQDALTDISEIKYGSDIINDLRTLQEVLFGSRDSLTPEKLQEIKDKIIDLQDMLWDENNGFLKPNYKTAMDYEGKTWLGAETRIAELSPEAIQFYHENEHLFENIRERLNERRRASNRIGSAGEDNREIYNWRYYMPFKGGKEGDALEEFKDDFDLFESTGYLNDGGDELMKGRTTIANDPIAQLEHDLIRSGRKMVDSELEQAIYKIALVYGPESGVTIKDKPYDISRIKYLRGAGTKLSRGKIGRKPNTIVVHMGDNAYLLTITNRDLFSGIKNHWTKTSEFAKIAYKPVKFMARLKTYYNTPWAMYTNFVREFRQQLIYGALDLSYDKETKKFDFTITKEYMKNVLKFRGYVDALQYYTRDYTGKLELEAQGSDFAKWANKFASLGGESTFLQSLGIENIQERLQQVAEAGISDPNLISTTRKNYEKAKTFYDGVLNGVDLSTRVALFKAIVEHSGKSEAEAANYVKNLMNFNYKGLWGDGLKALYLFYGPSAAGVFRMLHTVLRNENPYQTWALMGMYSASTAFMYALANGIAGEDDDGEDKFKKIDNYTFVRYSVLPTVTDGNTLPIIPKAIGLETLVAAPGILAARAALGHTNATNAVATMFRTALDNASFVAPAEAGDAPNATSVLGAVLGTITPSVVRPLAEIRFNQDAMGLQIYNGFRDENTPWYMQARDNTDDIYVKMSKLMYNFNIDVAPEAIKHAFLQYLGVFASATHRLYTMEDKVLRGEDLTSGDIPFMPTVSTKDIRFYPQRVFSEARADWKEGVQEYNIALDSGNTPSEQNKLAYSIDRQIERYDRRINKALDSIRESNLPPEEKAAKIRGLRKMREIFRAQLINEWKNQTGAKL